MISLDTASPELLPSRITPAVPGKKAKSKKTYRQPRNASGAFYMERREKD
jgi:hypothetical protein